MQTPPLMTALPWQLATTISEALHALVQMDSLEMEVQVEMDVQVVFKSKNVFKYCEITIIFCWYNDAINVSNFPPRFVS